MLLDCSMKLFHLLRRPFHLGVRSRLQVQSGEDETENGPDSDHENGSSGILQRMESVPTGNANLPQSRVRTNLEEALISFILIQMKLLV